MMKPFDNCFRQIQRALATGGWLFATFVSVQLAGVLPALGSAALVVDTLQGQPHWVRRYGVEPNQTLEVQLGTGGEVSLQTWSQHQVEVTADLSGPDWALTQVRLSQDQAGLSLQSGFADGRTSGQTAHRWVIKVPESFHLRLQSESGKVSLQGLHGQVTGQLMQGDLSIEQCFGRLQLATVQGNVTVRGGQLEGEVRSGSGTIQLQDVQGGLQALAPPGGVRITPPSSPAPYQLSYAQGDILLASAPQGGGISTTQGNLQINSAEGELRVSAGGDLTLPLVKGNLEASTYGGTLQVTLAGDASSTGRLIRLWATDGDVVLTVPASLSLDLVVEITRSEDNQQSYRLQSDFPLENLPENSPAEAGSLDSYRQARQVIAGGKNTLQIRVTNGNVRLIKAPNS